MGAFSFVLLNEYPFLSNRNGYYEDVVKEMFTNDDFVEEVRYNSSRNRLYWGNQFENDSTTYTFRGLRQTAAVIKQRLEIYGTSLKKVKLDYKCARKYVKLEYPFEHPIRNLSFDTFILQIRSIIYNLKLNKEVEDFYLRETLNEIDLMLPGMPLSSCLYCCLQALDNDHIIEYDLSDVIEARYVSIEEFQNIPIEKIIVLTEGKTDSEFISGALKLLYPHLASYYHFIDFNDDLKPEASASALSRLIVSFCAAKIKHPIIAIFDNDTTGLQELDRIPVKALPSNIRTLRLPDIALAKKYPTLGPTGLRAININGLACGIELYLGMDVLTRDGNLIPVQWKGYNDKRKQYQGELMDKHFVQTGFRNKLRAGDLGDTNQIDMVLKAIFQAFD